MPRIENTALPNRHTGYIAMSGCGKSQALLQNKVIPARGARLVAWDPNRDHKGVRCGSLGEFAKMLLRGVKSGGGFRLLLTMEQKPEYFERFCAVVISSLRGDKLTYILIEELARVQTSSGKASRHFGELCAQSRKYGGVIHWTSQGGAEVSQTALENTDNYYIGRIGDMATDGQRARLARIAGCKREELGKLEPLEFYVATPFVKKRVKLRYKSTK